MLAYFCNFVPVPRTIKAVLSELTMVNGLLQSKTNHHKIVKIGETSEETYYKKCPGSGAAGPSIQPSESTIQNSVCGMATT